MGIPQSYVEIDKESLLTMCAEAKERVKKYRIKRETDYILALCAFNTKGNKGFFRKLFGMYLSTDPKIILAEQERMMNSTNYLEAYRTDLPWIRGCCEETLDTANRLEKACAVSKGTVTLSTADLDLIMTRFGVN